MPESSAVDAFAEAGAWCWCCFYIYPPFTPSATLLYILLSVIFTGRRPLEKKVLRINVARFNFNIGCSITYFVTPKFTKLSVGTAHYRATDIQSYSATLLQPTTDNNNNNVKYSYMQEQVHTVRPDHFSI